ncbi:putative germin-like protein 9-2 [Gossypium arboreum]|nr:putative germin-like protein 9-2 [Gossypium arboreum]
MYLGDYLKIAGMGIISCIHAILFVLMLSQVIHGSKIDLKLDCVIPPNITTDDANFFTHTAFRVLIGADPPTAFEFMKVSEAEFPALDDQGVSYAVLQFPPCSLNPSHRHPHAAELLFLLIGSLKVGFVDANDVLHTQTLQTGDLFIFPVGVVHYQYNYGQDLAFAISAFGSANVRTIPTPGLSKRLPSLPRLMHRMLRR